MITSAQNPKIQWVRRLQAQARARAEEGVFVVEGVRLVEEALQAAWPARLVLYSPQLKSHRLELVSKFGQTGALVEEVSPHVLASASDTQTPQGILAVIARQELPVPENLDFVLIVDALRDPGNLGTMLRSAAAAGAQVVMIAPGTADVFAPKVVRAAMGAHFHLPICRLDWPAIEKLVHPSLRVYLADSKGERVYTHCNFTLPLALVVGGEAAGAGGRARQLADEHLRIPMTGQVESLNAATAATVLLFEVARQRAA